MSDDCMATRVMRIMHINNYDDWEEAQIAGIEFDRWLAAHDAEIRTATLDEAAVIVKGNLGRIWIVAETLGDIAAAIRASKVDPR